MVEFLKKRICLITSSFPHDKSDPSYGGAIVRDFALLLAKERYDVHVLTPSRKDSKNYDKEINVHFFSWLDVEWGLSSLNPRNLIHFFRLVSVLISGLFTTVYLVKKNKIDVCLALWAIPSGIFALAAKTFFKTPYFVWALGSDIYRIQDYPFGTYILKKVLKNADKLFADGIELVQIIQKISKRKCDFLATGHILDTKQQEINYNKFDSTKTNFIFLGRYHESKGVDLLLEAINLLNNEEKKKCLFHVFGEGPLEKKLKQKVREWNLEYNTFINSYVERDKVFSYLSKSDYVVIPSRSDSISLVLFEAVQANKPLILTNVGDVGKIMTNYNIGIIVESNAKSIAEGIRQAIKSPSGQLDSFISIKNDLKNFLDPQKSLKILIESFDKIK